MIDIIIPTRNRVNTLKLVLPTYLKQKFVNKIIIIDDASNEENKKGLEEIKKLDHRIILKRFDDQIFLPQARNEGIKLSNAPYIFMGEDDVYLDDNHFEVLLNLMNEYNADLIAGRRIYIKQDQTFEEAKKNANSDKNPVFTIFPFEGYFERYLEKDIIDAPFLHSNALIKKEVYKEILYDSNYKGNSFREELDFYVRCKERGFKMVLTNKTVCYHIKDKINIKGGARLKRLKYECYVWKNTLYFFKKNKKILEKYYNVKCPILFGFLSLLMRYPYAIYRRLKWKIKRS